MKERMFGSSKRMVSEIGLGTWQLGTKWGDPFNEEEALKILQAMEESHITFIDTADIYNDNKSELTIGKFLKTHPNKYYITTKCGKGLHPDSVENYTPEVIEQFVDGSLKRMGLKKLDMILLHCPPIGIYDKPEIFEKLEQLKAKGKIAGYGVSIERIEEGIRAMKYGISAIEVIFNMFRLKPLEELFPLCKQKDIAVIVRVPLASGLLTGKYDKNTKFGPKDHRTNNRNGECFDKGETFSGVDYELGLKAVEELKKVFQTDNLAPYALKWILMHDAVSVVIPGASRAQQVYSNVKASELDDLSDEQMKAVEDIYNKYIRASVHDKW